MAFAPSATRSTESMSTHWASLVAVRASENEPPNGLGKPNAPTTCVPVGTLRNPSRSMSIVAGGLTLRLTTHSVSALAESPTNRPR